MLDILEDKLAKGLLQETQYSSSLLASYGCPQMSTMLGLKSHPSTPETQTYTIIMEKSLLWESSDKKLVQAVPVLKVEQSPENCQLNTETEVAIVYERLELDQCLFCKTGIQSSLVKLTEEGRMLLLLLHYATEHLGICVKFTILKIN